MCSCAIDFFYNLISLKNHPHFYLYHPKSCTERIIAQNAFFTVHENPFIPVQEDKYIKFIIHPKDKFFIKNELRKIGIHRYSLFPDCEGLCVLMKENYFPSSDIYNADQIYKEQKKKEQEQVNSQVEFSASQQETNGQPA